MIKNKISEKKFFMMLSTELFAMTSLILPAVLVGFAGKNGLPVLLVASGGLLLLTAWYLTCYRIQNKSLDQVVDEKKGVIRLLLKVVYVIRFFVHGLFLMIVFVNLIQEVLLQDYNFFWILTPVLLLVYLMGGKQLRVRGRILEVLFPYIFIPLLVVLFLALFQLDYSSLPEQLWGKLGQQSENSLLYSIYGILLFYQPVEFVLFLLPALGEDRNEKSKKRTAYVAGAACVFVIVINVIMYVAAIGMFGTVRTGEKLWSALYIMQSVRLPGKFVERLDILFLVFWIFSAFALFSAYMYYGSRFVVSEFDSKEKNATAPNQEKNISDRKKGKWYTAIWLLGILIFTLLIEEPQTMFELFIPYKMWVDFPLSFLLPVLLYAKKGRKMGRKGISVAVTVILCGCIMTGCQDRADIEDRNYVMTIGVEKGKEKRFRISYEIADLSQNGKDGGGRKANIVFYEADSLKEAEKTDWSRDDKKLDYGHLKAMVFSKALMEMGDFKEALLEELEKLNSIAGTTLLFFTEEELQDVMKTGEKKASSFGEYMDQMMANQKSGLAKEDTLSKLLRDEAEQIGEREVCLIKVVGEQIELGTGSLKNNRTAARLTDAVLRFHIRANSDSSWDQQRKIEIKDRILPKLQTLLSEADSKEECVSIIETSIGVIESWVEEAGTENESDSKAKVYMCKEKFPTKVYGDILWPSGTYDALRIDLGKAEGANWWCMMYPSSCFQDGVLEPVSEEDKEDGERKSFHVRWKIAEWFSKIIPNLS